MSSCCVAGIGSKLKVNPNQLPEKETTIVKAIKPTDWTEAIFKTVPGLPYYHCW